MSLICSSYIAHSRTVFRRIASIAVIIALSIPVSGCSSLFPGVYKIDIQQGNQLKDGDVEQLRVGMTESQVVFLLGSPTIQDPFHAHRWDYIYRLKTGGGAIRYRHVKVEFKDGYVSAITPGKWVEQPS